MKKIINILLIALMGFALFGCSANPSIESQEINATTNIAYNSETKQIEVSNVILKCLDSYYGIVVNDAINYSNKNNYFTTASGLSVAITSEQLEPGVNKDNGFTAIQEIDDGVFMVINGGDKQSVEDAFGNVFKTNELCYQMFMHDINADWTDEVVITSDVVSFSNGIDTTYIYHNPGSLSDGCLNGVTEPTVFKKQLRGIDIPITYPEDDSDPFYCPYGPKQWENVVIDGFTPYSAFDIGENASNYIILSNSNNNVLDLFEKYNNYPQTAIAVSLSSKNVDTYLFDNVSYNLSDVKNIANDVVNSENRYHFGLLTDKDETQIVKDYMVESVFNGLDKYHYYDNENYYIDGHSKDTADKSNLPSGNYDVIKVYNEMRSKYIIPTSKTSVPAYNGGSDMTQDSENAVDYFYGANYTGIERTNHGSSDDIDAYFYADLNAWQFNNNIQFILEGDYLYEIDARTKALSIYKNYATNFIFGFSHTGELNLGPYLPQHYNLYPEKWKNFTCDLVLLACTNVAPNSYYQLFDVVSTYRVGQ